MQVVIGAGITENSELYSKMYEYRLEDEFTVVSRHPYHSPQRKAGRLVLVLSVRTSRASLSAALKANQECLQPSTNTYIKDKAAEPNDLDMFTLETLRRKKKNSSHLSLG